MECSGRMQRCPGMLEALSPLGIRVPNLWTRCIDQIIAQYRYGYATDTTRHYIVGTNDGTA